MNLQFANIFSLSIKLKFANINIKKIKNGDGVFITMKKHFMQLQQKMIFDLGLCGCIEHHVTKGNFAEEKWIEWLRKYLPKRYSVDKAFAIDCYDNISKQTDILIYDRQYSPFVFNESDAMYIPAESIYAVFEVKQDFSKKNLIDASEKIASVRKLHRTNGKVYHVDGESNGKKLFKIIGGLLATKSSWKEPFGLDFERCLNELDNNRVVDLGCAIKEGSFLFYKDKNQIQKSTKEEALIFFFLKLFVELQKRATVPAIEIDKYAQCLDSF